MKKAFLLSTFLFIISYLSLAQLSGEVFPYNIEVYPTHWWVGMKWNKVQVMVHTIFFPKGAIVKMKPYTGVHLLGVDKPDNHNYLFFNLSISASAKPGMVEFSIRKDSTYFIIDYELKPRRKDNGNAYAQGVTAADLIYLIMPDRFSNGDPSNDKFADMNDTSSDRSNPFLRHGGDLQGITNHLNYFNDLGVTALWLTPVIENDQSLTIESRAMRSAYHGYAFTNQYKMDKRFGGNEAYKKLVSEAHAHGIKIIQDAVYNHIGNKHFLFLDPPSKDWFNQWPAYTNTTYKDQPLVDKYASKYDYNVAVNGWFTPFMPDVNQRDPYVANFLIQYAIWAVEEFGIDGWRVDTYFYSDRDFLNKINKALYDEFPHISIFGETTTNSVTEQAYFSQNNLNVAWKSNLQGVTDYEWFSGALASLKENSGEKLYNKLVQDILYKDPMRNEIFFDNHDQDRFYSVIGEDFAKYKMGIALLLTQRGIPQIYYGTEILMKNLKNPSDAEVRRDFPGGWKEDTVNKFISSGRTAQENEAYNYVKILAHFRQNSSAIKSGKMMQFLPDNGLYVYFRYDKDQTVMCVMNSADNEKEIDLKKYSERINGFNTARNVVDDAAFKLSDKISIPAKQFWVLELK
ncbi:MAG TPA: alpha-amylase family glycosyl hydrolase [Puia sp.]|nr:alpha-amylase family glycosyl hydrolase [Puia sp.]